MLKKWKRNVLIVQYQNRISLNSSTYGLPSLGSTWSSSCENRKPAVIGPPRDVVKEVEIEIVRPAFAKRDIEQPNMASLDPQSKNFSKCSSPQIVSIESLL